MFTSTVLMFALGIFIIPFALSQSTSGALPCHVCTFIGEMEASTSNFQFSISDVPERCESVIYSSYLLSADDTPMFSSDEEAIKSLVAVKKTVFIMLSSYNGNIQTWEDILDPKDQALYDKNICPLIQKINDLGLHGIIIAVPDIYGIPINDLANKIKEFITKIKVAKPTLKFGLYVNTPFAKSKITDNSLFDYSIINSMIDIYILDMFTHQTCNEQLLAFGGSTVITSTDPAVVSLNKFVDFISNSSIDQSKTFARTQVTVYLPKSEGYAYVPYNQFCKTSLSPADLCKTCLDNTTNLYNEGGYIKQHFYGIEIAWLDYDDFDNACECQPYPATKALLGGFDGETLTPCPKLNVK